MDSDRPDRQDPTNETTARAAGEDLPESGWIVLPVPSDRRDEVVERALDLSRVAAAGGRRVVLVDAGVTEPLLFDRYDLHASEGLSDWALYGASIGRVAQTVEGEDFRVIPAGTVVTDPAPIFGSRRWESLAAAFDEAEALLLVLLPTDLAGSSSFRSRADGIVELTLPSAVDTEEMEAPGVEVESLAAEMGAMATEVESPVAEETPVTDDPSAEDLSVAGDAEIEAMGPSPEEPAEGPDDTLAEFEAGDSSDQELPELEESPEVGEDPSVEFSEPARLDFAPTESMPEESAAEPMEVEEPESLDEVTSFDAMASTDEMDEAQPGEDEDDVGFTAFSGFDTLDDAADPSPDEGDPSLDGSDISPDEPDPVFDEAATDLSEESGTEGAGPVEATEESDFEMSEEADLADGSAVEVAGDFGAADDLDLAGAEADGEAETEAEGETPDGSDDDAFDFGLDFMDAGGDGLLPDDDEVDVSGDFGVVELDEDDGGFGDIPLDEEAESAGVGVEDEASGFDFGGPLEMDEPAVEEPEADFESESDLPETGEYAGGVDPSEWGGGPGETPGVSSDLDISSHADEMFSEGPSASGGEEGYPEAEEERSRPDSDAMPGTDGEAVEESTGAPPGEGRPGAAAAPKKRSRAPLLLLFILILGGAGVVYAGLEGYVRIPGLTPEESAAGVVLTSLPTEGPDPISEVMGWSLAVDAYREESWALDQQAALSERLPDHLFVVSPVEVQGQLYYRLLVGPARNQAEAEEIRATLRPVLSREDASAWIVRATPIAYLMGELPTLDQARRRAEVLNGLGVWSYVLEVEYPEDQTAYRVYSGAYEDETEALALRRILEERNVENAQLTRRIGHLP